MAVETPEREQAGDEGAAGAADGARTDAVPPAASAGVPLPVVTAVLAVAALVWVVLRPGAPQGAAAAVDLLVLPALLALEVGVLAGRPSIVGVAGPASFFGLGAGGGNPVVGSAAEGGAAIRPSSLAAFFGLGAVGATVSVLVAERLLRVAGAGALDVAPVIEVVAVCGPPVVFAWRTGTGRCGEGPVDAALAGLATGLGFLVVGTSLATAAAHVAPDYVSPLAAGLSRVPAAGGDPAVYFAGLPMVAALAGLAAGTAFRLRRQVALAGLAAGLAVRLRREVALVVPALAVALAAFDHSVFQWRHRHLVAGEPAVLGGPADVVRTLTLHGRLTPVLLVAGLAAARLVGRRPPPGERPPEPADEAAPRDAEPPAVYDAGAAAFVVDLRDEAAGAGAPVVGTAVGEDLRDEAAGAEAPGPTPAGDDRSPDVPGHPWRRAAGAEAPGPTADGDDRSPDVPGHPWRRAAAVLAVSVPVAGGLVVLARGDGLGFLEQRPVAVAVALAGLAYAAASLAAVPGPEREAGESRALSVAAAACAAAGVVWSLLPTTPVPRPVHGGLLVDAALGWAASVGNLGVVLGLGGFAAPPARLGRLPRNGFLGVLGGRRRQRHGSGVGGSGGKGLGGGRWGWTDDAWGGRVPWWRPARRRRERLRLAAAAEEALLRTRAAQQELRPVVVTVEPARARPLSQVEFTGATVKEAMVAAFAHLGDLTHSSLQLVDEGAPAAKGVPARPAKVRVVETADEEPPLLPPRRDAIVADAPFVVVVDVAREGRDEHPEVVHVVLRAPDHGTETTLRCHRQESSGGRDRYRSNPYTVTGGEEPGPGDPDDAERGAPLPVADGRTLEAECLDERAVLTVHGSWSSLVVGVNRALAALTEANHAGVVRDLEDLVRLEAPGHDDARLHHRIEQLRTRLAYAARAARVLDGPDDLDARAFRSTAVLATAMSLDRRYDDPTGATALLRDAGEALREHRRAVLADPAADVATGAYRRFLATTPLGRVWAEGITSDADLSRLMGWYRLSDLGSDPAAVPAAGTDAR
jgi:hypothetical protein